MTGLPHWSDIFIAFFQIIGQQLLLFSTKTTLNVLSNVPGGPYRIETENEMQHGLKWPHFFNMHYGAVIMRSIFNKIFIIHTHSSSRLGVGACWYVILWNVLLKKLLLSVSRLQLTYVEIMQFLSWWRHQMETFPRYWSFLRPRWIPHTNTSEAALWCLPCSAPE